MKKTLRHLWDSLSHQPSKVKELKRLRVHFAHQPKSSKLSLEEKELSFRMRLLGKSIIDLMQETTSCANCAKGCPLPNGRWDGGFCCGGNTEDLFTPQEISALYVTGTRPKYLKAPHSDHAGCIFRGAEGCSLPVKHRPNICLSYICNELARELALLGNYDEIEAVSKQLDQLLAEHKVLFEKRQEEELFHFLKDS